MERRSAIVKRITLDYCHLFSLGDRLAVLLFYSCDNCAVRLYGAIPDNFLHNANAVLYTHRKNRIHLDPCLRQSDIVLPIFCFYAVVAFVIF